jgi:hypothetical protein
MSKIYSKDDLFYISIFKVDSKKKQKEWMKELTEFKKKTSVGRSTGTALGALSG